MEIAIVTETEQLSLQQLKEYLETRPEWAQSTVALETRYPQFPLRTTDPALLIALVGVLGTGLGALITGLLDMIKQIKSQAIEIHGKSGRILKVPANISPEELDQLIERAIKLDIERIVIK